METSSGVLYVDVSGVRRDTVSLISLTWGDPSVGYQEGVTDSSRSLEGCEEDVNLDVGFFWKIPFYY